jgi:hypothetical protein
MGLRRMRDMGVPKKTKAGVGKSIKCESVERCID